MRYGCTYIERHGISPSLFSGLSTVGCRCHLQAHFRVQWAVPASYRCGPKQKTLLCCFRFQTWPSISIQPAPGIAQFQKTASAQVALRALPRLGHWIFVVFTSLEGMTSVSFIRYLHFPSLSRVGGRHGGRGWVEVVT